MEDNINMADCASMAPYFPPIGGKQNQDSSLHIRSIDNKDSSRHDQ